MISNAKARKKNRAHSLKNLALCTILEKFSKSNTTQGKRLQGAVGGNPGSAPGSVLFCVR